MRKRLGWIILILPMQSQSYFIVFIIILKLFSYVAIHIVYQVTAKEDLFILIKIEIVIPFRMS